MPYNALQNEKLISDTFYSKFNNYQNRNFLSHPIISIKSNFRVLTKQSTLDDVLAGGMISTANNKDLSKQGYRSELVVVYSYLPKLTGPMAKVRISSLTDINALCETGLKLEVFNKNNVKIIKKECIWSNK